MNSLSWMIYLGNLLDNLNVAIAICVLCGIFIGGFCTIVGAVPWTEYLSDSPNEKAQKIESRMSFKRYGKRLLVIGIVAAAIGIFAPSSTTAYLIAASQAGEVIVKDPEMQGIFNDLKTIIKQKIKDQLPKPS